ncbi:MAG: hypothetical protein ACKV2U_34560 [Bryobacteraceae bacterium]
MRTAKAGFIPVIKGAGYATDAEFAKGAHETGFELLQAIAPAGRAGLALKHPLD